MPKEKIYKQLIISIYDSWYYGEVMSNGKREHSMEKTICRMYNVHWSIYNKNFQTEIMKKYACKYDNIIICENGEIEVLK